MRNSLVAFWISFFASLIAAPIFAADDPGESGWVSLFNGKDLTGWRIHDKPNDAITEIIKIEKDGKVIGLDGKLALGTTAHLWRVENGLLIGRGPLNHLFSARGDYGNFQFRIEAKINDGGNSGQFFRAEFGPFYVKGYEAQINATHRDRIKTGSLYFPEITENLILDTAPHRPAEFFVQEVTAIDDSISISVNGKKTVNNFRDPIFRYKRGHFALQALDANTEVVFRKIEVKELEQQPILALDAGGHTAGVSPAMFTPDGKEIITVSRDGAIRWWNVQSGQTVRTLRPHYIPGSAVGGAALSPDGKLLAVARSGVATTEQWILLIDQATGEIKRALPTDHTGLIQRLCFSPNGKYLASASDDMTARLWNVATGKSEQVLRGHTWGVRGLAFTADGKRLLTSSGDQTARLWSLEKGKTEVIFQDKENRAYTVSAVAISPNEKTVVTAHWGNGIRVWNMDGSLRKHLVQSKACHDLCFTKDSETILVAGGGTFVLDLSTGQILTEFKKHRQELWSCALSPDGSLACTAGGSDDVYLWKMKDASVVHQLAGKGKRIIGVAWSPDGKQVAWGNVNGRQGKGWGILPERNDENPLDSSFSLDELQLGGTPKGSWNRFILRTGDLSLSRNVNSGRMTLMQSGTAGTTIPDQFRTGFTFVTGDRLALGGGDGLALYQASTGKLLHRYPGRYPIVEVCASPDNRYLLSGGNDQVLRIWKLDKPELVLSLFVAGEDWIAWTPEGYYAASPTGEKLIGWQVNHGLETPASFYPAAQFGKTFYRPDAIKLVLAQGGVQKALGAADKLRGVSSNQIAISAALPPRIAFMQPAKSGTVTSEAKFEVKVSANGENQPITSLRLLVDGRPYQGEKSLRTVRGPASGSVKETWTVELPPGMHRLAVVASSSVSQGVSEEIEILVTPASAPTKPPTTNLHLLSIGVNAYPGKMELNCAVPDAKLVDETFRNQTKGLYQVHSTLLLDRQATRSAILQGLDDLQKKTKSGDVAVVFYAGHGDCKRTGQFHILPIDVNVKELAKTGISGEELRGKMARLPCTAVLIMDCCYAGSFDATKKKRALPTEAGDLVRDLVRDDQGLVVMCGASKDEESGEESRLGHGFFTKALTEGLSGKAASSRDGLVYLSGLQAYIDERVRVLSNDEQYPTMGKPTLIRSFPLSSPFARNLPK